MVGSQHIKERIERIITSQLGIALEDLSVEACFIGDLGADPLDVEEILAHVGQQFDFHFDDTERQEITRVDALIAFARAKLNCGQRW